MLLVFLGSPVFALAKDGDRVPAPASATDSARPASTSAANGASATTSTSPNAVVATPLPDALPMSEEIRTVEPMSPALSAGEPSLGNALLANNSLAPIHALMAPPAAIVKLKTPPPTHSFFDSRIRLGLATLAASLAADALPTKRGPPFPGLGKITPTAPPLAQARGGGAAYNAGSFGLVAGLMYW